MAHIGGVEVGNAHTQLVLHWDTHCGVGVGVCVHVVVRWCYNTSVLCYIGTHFGVWVWVWVWVYTVMNSLSHTVVMFIVDMIKHF